MDKNKRLLGGFGDVARVVGLLQREDLVVDAGIGNVRQLCHASLPTVPCQHTRAPVLCRNRTCTLPERHRLPHPPIRGARRDLCPLACSHVLAFAPR